MRLFTFQVPGFISEMDYHYALMLVRLADFSFSLSPHVRLNNNNNNASLSTELIVSAKFL